MMAILKVWCLPAELTEEDLQSLFGQLLLAVKSVPEAEVKDQNDITILFPPDRMKWGLGEDIIAEVTDLPISMSFDTPSRILLAKVVGEIIRKRFPAVNVIKCSVESPSPSNETWISKKPIIDEKPMDDDGHNFYCGVERGPRDPNK